MEVEAAESRSVDDIRVRDRQGMDVEQQIDLEASELAGKTGVGDRSRRLDSQTAVDGGVRDGRARAASGGEHEHDTHVVSTGEQLERSEPG